MPPSGSALGSNDADGDDDLRRQSRLAARAARFNNVLPGNRYRELEEARTRERQAFLQQGLITSGKTQLGDAVDMRGTCEGMCCEFEIEFREFTKEIHPFEATPDRRMDHAKAVAAYSRSDAGAGHGDSAILPSDLRTPAALVRSLDYLFDKILPIQPPQPANAVRPQRPTARRALGYSAGFIRDRTRAIRKEFAMQSSWGHEEAIASFERIARWHILCLRELQEESGSNTDMHIDAAELGRCFTSLRQHYNDRREELGVEMPCANEPEFRAYMLIFDLASKSVSIPTAELPASVLDHPLVKLAWQIRQAAQRNFDSQKEGSKLNAELGINLITRFIHLLKQVQVPYLLSCLVEIRLRDMRRSTIRALTRTYPRLRADPIRLGESGQILERRMVLVKTLDRLLGAEEQEDDEPAWDDVQPSSKNPDDEAVNTVKRFGLDVYSDASGPVGALINLGSPYNDNKDAPFTRRWKSITSKKGTASYADIVNGRAGVDITTVMLSQTAAAAVVRPFPNNVIPSASHSPSIFGILPSASTTITAPTSAPPSLVKPAAPFPTPSKSFAPSQGVSSSAQTVGHPVSAFNFTPSSTSAFAPLPPPAARTVLPAFTPVPLAPSPITVPTPSVFTPTTPSGPAPLPSLPKPEPRVTPTSTPSLQREFPTTTSAPPSSPGPVPQESIPTFFASSAQAGPSKSIPIPHSLVSTPILAPPVVSTLQTIPTSMSPSPKKSISPPLPLSPQEMVRPRVEMSRQSLRAIAPMLRDRLVDEVFFSILRSSEPEMKKIVRQYSAARAHTAAKAMRRSEIERFADLAVNAMLTERIDDIVRGVIASERRVRLLARRVTEHWRSWVAHMSALRAEAAKEREQMFSRLSGMGLTHSLVNYNSVSSKSSVWSVSEDSADRLDEMEVDLGLHQAEKTKDQLFAASTFLHAIARHVAPFLDASSSDLDDPPVIWDTVLLTAENAASPASSRARQWLTAKFLPVNGEEVHQDGVEFTTTITDVQGEFPGSADTGLFVFEAPLDSISLAQRDRNADDAADRLEAASGAAQQQSRYRSALLIITWEDETLDEVVNRLQIDENTAAFDTVRAISLERAEDLDGRFAQVLRELVPSDPRKVQVVMDVNDMVTCVAPLWQTFIELIQLVLVRHPLNITLAEHAMRAGIATLAQLPDLIDVAVGELPVSAESTYTPVQLPLFGPSEAVDVLALAEVIIQYLSVEPLNSIDDIALILGPLRQAADQEKALPIIEILQSISLFVFGELGQQNLQLDIWLRGPEQREAVAKLCEDVKTMFDSVINEAMTTVARVAKEVERAVDQTLLQATAPAKRFPAAILSTKANAAPKGTKRRADDGEDRESKAAKNARLLRALAEVNATLNQLDGELGY